MRTYIVLAEKNLVDWINLNKKYINYIYIMKKKKAQNCTTRKSSSNLVILTSVLSTSMLKKYGDILVNKERSLKYVFLKIDVMFWGLHQF